MDNTTITFIQNVVQTAKALKIQNIIIEPGKVRALDDDQTVVIYQDSNVPSMEFGSLGLNRLDVFISRFDIIRSTPGFSLEVTTIGEDNTIGYDVFDMKNKNKAGIKQPMWAKSITMSGLNTTIDYRCANPAVIKAPKNRTDNSRYQLAFTDNAFAIMQRGKTAMNSNYVTITGNSRGTQLSVTDDNGDSLKYKFGKNVNCLIPGEEHPSFSYNYPIEKLIPLFKNNPNTDFCITHRGFLVGTLNELTIYIAPTTQV